MSASLSPMLRIAVYYYLDIAYISGLRIAPGQISPNGLGIYEVMLKAEFGQMRCVVYAMLGKAVHSVSLGLLLGIHPFSQFLSFLHCIHPFSSVLPFTCSPSSTFNSLAVYFSFTIPCLSTSLIICLGTHPSFDEFKL